MRLTLQHDTADCGPACVRMICSHYGRDIPLTRLRTLTGQTREGVSVHGLRVALEGFGLRVQALMPNLPQLREELIALHGHYYALVSAQLEVSI